MNRIQLAAAFALGTWLVLATPLAQAQATRTWVSGVGDDANPCSRTAPCKTFAGAISKTAAGGEINILDGGGYGTLTVTKSITVDGSGAHAGVLNALVNGIVLNTPGIVVTLRNLSINGVGTGLNGINALAFATLQVENVVISGLSGNGIHVAATAAGNVYVRDTLIRRPCNIGFRSATTAGTINALLTNVSIDGCTTGIDAMAGSKVQVRNTTISHAIMGVGASAGATVTLDHSSVTHSNTGVAGHGGPTTIRLSRSTVLDNVVGLSGAAGAQILSYGNNALFGNGTNGAVTSTLAEQ